MICRTMQSFFFVLRTSLPLILPGKILRFSCSLPKRNENGRLAISEDLRSTERLRRLLKHALIIMLSVVQVPRRLLAPLPFPLARMLAIFHAILPQAVSTTADLQTQITTLTSLRLLLRSGVGANGDALDPNAKWKVNVGYEYVVKMARSVNFEVQDYLAE